jgi:uncharacterized protein (DUF488 family)
MISRIWTIGHSTRPIEEFISLLQENGITLLADVRSWPGSKRYPHFNKEALADSLGKSRIRYEHFPELGGRRKPKPHSHNMAWRNASFRAYADYMETEEFRKGIERLLRLARGAAQGVTVSQPSRSGSTAAQAVVPWGTAIMCAEAVWWRCHRSLISDYLKARGIDVTHIVDANKVQPHPYTSAARIVNGQLSYAKEDSLL